MDAGQVAAVVAIVGFGAFVVWGRTSGRLVVRRGEQSRSTPRPRQTARRPASRRAGSRQRRPASPRTPSRRARKS